MPVKWVSELRVEGEIAFRVGRDGDDLVAEWTELATLRADREGRASSFVPKPMADPRLVAKVRGGHAAALVRHLQGALSLHASVVARDGLAIACVGPSGAGKSTMAAELCRRDGWELVADDIAPVELVGSQIQVLPREKEHWLDESSLDALNVQNAPEWVGDKCPILAPRVASAPSRLVAIIVLAFGADATEAGYSRLRGHAALAPLVPCLARFVLDEPAVQAQEFSQLSAMCAHVPIFELLRPRRLRDLQRAGDALESLLASQIFGKKGASHGSSGQ
jgi:hypothetical protein